MSEQMELERCGYQVILAGTGEEAIRICYSEPAFDLILMDIDLGAGMSGPETATQLLKSYQVPVLFLSSHTEPEMVAKTEQISSYGYVVKSSGITVLDTSIKMALRLFQSNVRLESKKDRLRRAGEDLRESATRFHSIFHNAVTPMAVLLPNGQFVDVNIAFCEMFGYSESEVLGLSFLDLIHPEDRRSKWEVPLAQIMAGEISIYRTERRSIHKRGHILWSDTSVSVLSNPDGSPPYIVAQLHDITTRKNAEDELRRSEQFQKDVLNSLPAHIAVLGEKGKILAVNEPWLRFARANGDPAIEKIGVGTNYLEACRVAAAIGDPHAQAALEGIESVILGKQKHFEFEYPCNAPDCQRWFSMEALCSAGSVTTTILTHIDITTRKQAEEKVKTLLGEKERLLEEVHHRTKNSMYAIKNLLTIQSSTVAEEAGRATLLEAASRVQSMMMLYDNLLQSSSYLSVSIRPFLTSLADAVVASFSGNASVTIEKEIEDCVLSAGKTQPLGLILNELLTNSMKHAFVGRACGKVAVTFHVSEGRAVLVVQDDGDGLPGTVDFKRSSSLGLKLIHLLTKQIGGTARNERGKGTKVTVEFPT